jgi:pimeloyl-ACP methyl ester carboxylesterase
MLSLEPAGLIHRQIPLATGVALHVAERPGEGTPVVCLHGMWSWWRTWLPLLSPGPGSFAGRPLLMVDLRGHGASAKPANGYALKDYTADAVALVETLGVERVTLAGHSLGALTSLAAARIVPDRIESLLLEEPPLPFPTDLAHLDAFWTDFAEALVGLFGLKHEPPEVVVAQLMEWIPDLRRESAEKHAASVIATADGVFAEVSGGTFGGEELTTPGPPLAIPTLLFQGTIPGLRGLLDEGVAQIRVIVPDLRVEAIPDTGHSVLAGAPAAYRAAVAAFFGG